MRSRFRSIQEPEDITSSARAYLRSFGPVRIDTRPQSDPNVQKGARGLHRDTRGNVIGGYDAAGNAFGTKASKFRRKGAAGSSITPRLDAGPQTPGLDRLAAMQRTAPTESFADAAKRGAHESALSGAFGTGAKDRAKNLKGRKSLFARMREAGGGAITPDMEQEAAKLGVKKSRFRAVAEGLPHAPASIAANAAHAAVPSSLARRKNRSTFAAAKPEANRAETQVAATQPPFNPTSARRKTLR